MPYYNQPFETTPRPGQILNNIQKANENFTIIANAFQNSDPATGIVNNSDKVDNYHASQTPAPNTIPVAKSNGKLDPGWLPTIISSGGSSSTSSTSETYSRLSVGTVEPLTPNHNDLFYNTTLNTLKRYDSRTSSWIDIDWQNIIKASPEFISGRLRVNSTTGKLEISPNGTNWFECIPAVGSDTIELATVDNTNFSYKYWVAPGQTVIVRNSNHLPIISIPQNVFDIRIRISSSSAVSAYLLWVGNVSNTSYYAEIIRTDAGANSYIAPYTGHRIGWGGSNGLFTSFSQFSIVFNNNTVESTGSYKYYDSTYGLITFSNHSAYSTSIHWLGTVRRELGGNVLHNFEIATVTRRA